MNSTAKRMGGLFGLVILTAIAPSCGSDGDGDATGATGGHFAGTGGAGQSGGTVETGGAAATGGTANADAGAGGSSGDGGSAPDGGSGGAAVDAGSGGAGDGGSPGTGGTVSGCTKPADPSGFKADCSGTTANVTGGGQWYGLARYKADETSPVACNSGSTTKTKGCPGITCTDKSSSDASRGTVHVAGVTGTTATAALYAGFTTGCPGALGATGITFQYKSATDFIVRLGEANGVNPTPSQPGVTPGTCTSYGPPPAMGCTTFPTATVPASTTWTTATLTWDKFTTTATYPIKNPDDIVFVEFGVANANTNPATSITADIWIDAVTFTK